jgi:pyrroloquinoline-quinone synthase
MEGNPTMNDMRHPVDAWKTLVPQDMMRRLNATPFLTSCRKGTASREELGEYLLQQYHYSRHFTRYLCALLANMERDDDRGVMTENLFEEMGLSSNDGISHAWIYRNMLSVLHLDPEVTGPSPETKLLVDTMLRLAADPDPMKGLGALCLGAEAIVPELYAQILNGLIHAGFPEEDLVFFPMHIVDDDEHARTMGRIIEREIAHSPQALAALLEGGRESLESRIGFFEALACVPVI